MITVIVKIKEDPEISELGQSVAERVYMSNIAFEVREAFNKGGNPHAPIIEEFVGYVNTPVQNGYFRASFDEAYAAACQYIKDTDGATTCEIVSVEWEGQEMFETGLDADGNPEYLGMICGIPLKPE